MGDITRLDGAKLAPVDIICGGSPCQDLSVASCTRAGLAGARSGLFLEQIRVTKEMRDADIRRGRTGKSVRPRWFCWENVPACSAAASLKGRTSGSSWNRSPNCRQFHTFHSTSPLGLATCWEITSGSCILPGVEVFDAQYWPGTPQRRRRVFLVADFAGQSAPKILFDQESLPGHSAQGEGAGQALPPQLHAALLVQAGLAAWDECGLADTRDITAGFPPGRGPARAVLDTRSVRRPP